MNEPDVARSPIALIPTAEVRDASRGVRSGELTRVFRGVYALTDEWNALAPWDRYAARVHAAALRHPDSVFCLESASVLHGLPVFGDPGTVHVLRDDSSTSRVSGGVLVHTTSEHRSMDTAGGMLRTTVRDTVIDLARSRHNAVALAVGDAALRQDTRIATASLVGENESRASSRGRLRARWVLDRVSPSAESPLESVDRAVLEWLGFPRPDLQVRLGDEASAGDRVDKWWPEMRIAGEGDGDLKYDGRFGEHNTVMRERHARDARLFERGARAVVHWGWAEAIAATPLRAMLLSAGLPLVGPEDTAQLFSLRRALQPSPRRRDFTPATKLQRYAAVSSPG
ncbi:hypothetical protein [Microbacterium hatanonis]|uniref:Transcriptional regulator, AbiEi antitoxin, Type IV TA system n=1 Tax=Microbacterium hatanonis TaxID=404366 RepID=A0A5C8I561_9MICO|nr:hypothetical protein [Microbacterium hatanonis]TXK13439.1 hypothetical protein FVP77_08575 [Microbacterium hatanonis]